MNIAKCMKKHTCCKQNLRNMGPTSLVTWAVPKLKTGQNEHCKLLTRNVVRGALFMPNSFANC